MGNVVKSFNDLENLSDTDLDIFLQLNVKNDDENIDHEQWKKNIEEGSASFWENAEKSLKFLQ